MFHLLRWKSHTSHEVVLFSLLCLLNKVSCFEMPLLGKIVVIKRNGGDGTEFPLTASCLFGRSVTLFIIMAYMLRFLLKVLRSRYSEVHGKVNKKYQTTTITHTHNNCK